MSHISVFSETTRFLEEREEALHRAKAIEHELQIYLKGMDSAIDFGDVMDMVYLNKILQQALEFFDD